MTSNSAHLRYHRRANVRQILDLGCGEGDRAIALAMGPSNQVTGLDSSEHLLSIARERAERRMVDVLFVQGSSSHTPFDPGSFDEVLLLGDLFGHGATAGADVRLLAEAQRLLQPGGTLRLRFRDGTWLKNSIRPELIEPLPTGFVRHRQSLVEDEHCIRTEVVAADESRGFRAEGTLYEWLYTPEQVSDLLCRSGFEHVTFEEALHRTKSGEETLQPLSHIVGCTAPPA